MADGEEHVRAGGDDTPPEITEQRFAANLREARESSQLSQYALAQKMNDRGWPWRQQTVARVESGQRMVRLGEATAITEILRVPLDKLIQPAGDSRDAELLSEWIRRARATYKEIVSAAAELIITRGNLRSHPAVSDPNRAYQELQYMVGEARAVVEQLAPEVAIAEAVRDRAREAAALISRSGSEGTVVVRPGDFPDAVKIADALSEGEIIVLDLRDLDEADAQRFKDYASGALRSRRGSVTFLPDGRYQLAAAEQAVLHPSPGWEARGFKLEDQRRGGANPGRDGA